MTVGPAPRRPQADRKRDKLSPSIRARRAADPALPIGISVMRRLRPLLTLAVLVVGPAARAQFNEVVIDPALGRRPIFGPGGYIANGNGYGAFGPRGYGYYTGLYYPG